MSSRTFKFAATLLSAIALSATGVSAYQLQGRGTTGMGGGMGGPMGMGGGMGAGPGRATAQARILVAEKALAAIADQEKKGSPPKDAEEKVRWYRRLLDAEHDAGTTRPESLKAYADALRADEALAKKRFDAGEVGSLAYLDAQYQRLQAEKTAAMFGSGMGYAAMGGMGGMMGGGRGMAGGGAGGNAAMGGMTGGGQGMAGGVGGGNAAMGGMMASGAQGLAGGGGGFGDSSDSPPRRLPKQHPADLERNKSIEQRLEKAVDMQFHETPLEVVLKLIREKTADSGGKALPVYVDPIGLQEAEKTLQSPVSIELQDVPVRTTLRLVLQQLSLDYRVRDGLLYISSTDSLDEADEADAVQARRGGMGGGQGGPGGMGGGFR